MQQHPLSALFPAMPEAEFGLLVDDIRQRGLLEPIIVFDGQVLDGWHRYRACEIASRNPVTQMFDGGDPVGFVLARNLHRRHLTASQRAAAVVEAQNWRPNNGLTTTSAPGAGVSEVQMAKAADVGERTIRHAKEAHRAGLGDAVKAGKVSAKKAAEVAKLPPKQREQAVRDIEAGKPIKPSPNPKTVGPSDADALAAARAQIAELTEQRDDLADTARELNDRLTAFEKTEPDEQQREIMELQKKVVRLETEVSRLTEARDACQAKCNQLIAEVKRLRRGAK